MEVDYDRPLPSKKINRDKVNLDLDNLIDETAADTKRTYYKSIALNVVDKFIRFLSIGTTLAIGILGINLIYNPADGSSATAIAVLGFTSAGLIQAKSEFNLQERSSVLHICYQEYKDANGKLRELRVSNESPKVIIKKVGKIRRRIKKVDLTEFDSTIINIESGRFASQSVPISSNKDVVVQLDE